MMHHIYIYRDLLYHRMKVMGGLVGALVIDPSGWENVPHSLSSADSYVLVMSR